MACAEQLRADLAAAKEGEAHVVEVKTYSGQVEEKQARTEYWKLPNYVSETV